MENVSGASVVGKSLRLTHTWFLSATQRLFFLGSTDGSNGFLKICSAGGDVDVYVGDGGAADIQTQEGEFSVCEPARDTART